MPTRSRCSASSSSLAPASTAAVSSSCCKLASVARNQDFATSAASDWRANTEVRFGRGVLLFRTALAVADASPEIEFPGRADQPSLQAGVVAGHLAAATRQPGDCRPECATRGPNIGRGLFGPCCSRPEIRVVLDRFGDEFLELRIGECREPIVLHGSRAGAFSRPFVGRRRVGELLVLQFIGRRRRQHDAAGDAGEQDGHYD